MATNGHTEQEGASRIPVAYLILGYENNRNTIINFYRNAMTAVDWVDWVIDAVQPAVNSKIDWLPKEILAARKRGVKCRTVTDITRDNLSHCKEIANRVDELRHVDGISTNFGVTDVEFAAMVPSSAPRKELAQIQFIHSDVESVVEYKRLCFNLLWSKAMPAQSRIDELEKNVATSIRSERAKSMIDRVYSCVNCHQTFIYLHEVDEHKKSAGHEEFREYPLL